MRCRDGLTAGNNHFLRSTPVGEIAAGTGNENALNPLRFLKRLHLACSCLTNPGGHLAATKQRHVHRDANRRAKPAVIGNGRLQLTVGITAIKHCGHFWQGLCTRGFDLIALRFEL